MKKIKLVIAKGLKILLNPPALRNCSIAKNSSVCSGSELQNVKMDRFSYIGNKCFMVNVTIGKFCSIADKCSIGGAMHPIDRVSSSPVFHEGKNIMNKNFAYFPAIQTTETVIGNDVWIGMGAYVKAGVTIHDGAVIGMGSIVTSDVPAYEVWAGSPARKIKNRFEPEIAEKLQESAWWNWDEDTLAKRAHLFDDVEKFLEEL